MDIFPETLLVFWHEVMDSVQNVCRFCYSTPCSESYDAEQTVYSVICILIIIIIIIVICMVVVKLMFCLALPSVPRSASSMSFINVENVPYFRRIVVREGYGSFEDLFLYPAFRKSSTAPNLESATVMSDFRLPPWCSWGLRTSGK